MTETSSTRLMDLFAEAVELDEDARRTFIDRIEADDPGLARKLRALLAADSTEGPSLHAPIEEAAKSLSAQKAAEEAAEEEDRWLGREIGPWRIKRRIGAGGMGAVFYAERSDESYDQGAALKIMAAQLLDREGAARFRVERQILANLQHPHIARLIDGGTTDEGLPYLVMSYVEGERVDLYCDREALNVPDRLKLFMKICEAVDFAHRNLVVHRDLKPSNILIDTAGTPQLLDFGIAKLIDKEQLEMTMVRTSVDARVMTPEYASPEQVRGEQVSIATDVYALGVLLYRLLTGRSPYGSGHSSPHALHTAILSEDPKKPSSVVTEATTPDERSVMTDLGKQRGLRPEQLRSALSGDLDNIVLKCLQKEPERRYRTAADLADDIRRYLNRQPIEARGDDWAYKARKFIRRRAIPLGVTAGVIAIVAGLTTFYMIRLADERDQARIAAQQARQASDFLAGLFFNASPDQTPQGGVTAIDLLEKGQEQVDALAEQPRLQAQVIALIGRSYFYLGDVERAADLLRQSVTLQEQADTQDPLLFADTLIVLGQALSYNDYGDDIDEADEFLQRGIAILDTVEGADPLFLRNALAARGILLYNLDRSEEAIDLHRRALAITEQANDRESVASSLNNLALAYSDLGRLDEAEPYYRRAIAMNDEHLGELHPVTIQSYGNLGTSLMRANTPKDAETLLTEAIRRGEEVLLPTDAGLALYRAELGLAKMEKGAFEEGADVLREAIAISEEAFGENHVETCYQMLKLGDILAAAGDFDGAERVYMDADRRLSQSDAQAAPNIARQIRASRILAMLASGNATGARPLINEALEERDEISQTRLNILETYRAMAMTVAGEHEQAADLFADTITKIGDTRFEPPVYKMSVYDHQARSLLALGRIEEARNSILEAKGIAQNSVGPESWRMALLDLTHASIMRADGREDAAQALEKPARQRLIALFGNSDPRLQLGTIIR
ncbi:serine/threonine protein kinase [Parvularcula flava]|uniref:Serine/threonine protein kinase n=1 Tax=Aquisalinus luteolus TaxID=1566827 RepID=A0A8J3A1Z9_9PROT|nr:tetratricopeptide repeat protein [Aquisalinus luteolus]NHK27041.1 serine/threonine protein kinase [Aquisalinus luteolus]GGH94184.1 hypothetical protein GCM10011355_07770 [Aquisalinus luteolus]